MQKLVLTLAFLTSLPIVAEQGPASIETVMLRVKQAHTAEVMTIIQDYERRHRSYVCETPHFMQAMMPGIVVQGFGADQPSAYLMAGIKCINRICAGPLQRRSVQIMQEMAIDPSRVQDTADSLYLENNEAENLVTNLTDPNKANLLFQRIFSLSCEESAMLSVHAYDICFMGQICGENGEASSTQPVREQKSEIRCAGKNRLSNKERKEFPNRTACE